VSIPLKAPFPWFGGKAVYVEPFFGSGAVLLARPLDKSGLPTGDELVNDLDGLLANFWRSLRADPDRFHALG
jgi:DNA adenine methylase